MKARIRRVLALVVGVWAKRTPAQFTSGGDEIAADPARTYRWGFDDAAIGVVPAGYIRVLGHWAVEREPTAPSAPNVLRQAGRYSNPDFPRIVVEGLTFTDLILRVRCRPETGDLDRACGVMFRFKDSDNYYVTRANALEDNVRLYRVVNGDRQEIAGADLEVTSGEWHTLEVTARGSRLEVRWDGRAVIAADDATFEKGRIGLWTKADSVTAFDDLEAIAR